MFKLTKSSVINVLIWLVVMAFLQAQPTLAYSKKVTETSNPAVATKSIYNQDIRDLGRAPTADEIAAWDIDVRPDFKGLPPGSGSVEQGTDLYDDKCASCHGVFAESNEIFMPLVGGTTAADVDTGRVANLNSGTYPHRTTFMRLSQMSTLWDYINRAMPWNEPKSLKPDEVYAVIAYLLNLADLVNEDFVLSQDNIAQVQARLPNRNGMKKYEPMWLVTGEPDVQGDACMIDCETDTTIRSFIPDYARNAHGNLAEQNRMIGPVRGADTTHDRPKSFEDTIEMARAALIKQANPTAPAAGSVKGQTLAQTSGCLACHAVDKKILGPGFTEIAARYRDQADAPTLLAGRVRNGAQGTWGAIPMPANTALSDQQVKTLISWILGL